MKRKFYFRDYDGRVKYIYVYDYRYKNENN